MSDHFDLHIEREPETNLRAKWLKDPNAAFQWWTTELLLSGDLGYAENSIANYKAILGSFRRYVNNCCPKQNVLTIDSNQIKHFLDSLVGRARTPPITGGNEEPRKAMVLRAAQVDTKRRYVLLLSRLMDHLVENDCRSSNPFNDVEQYLTGSSDATKITLLSESNDVLLQEYLLHRFDISTWQNRRRRVMLLFMLGSGVKVGDATAATIDDFAIDNGTLCFFVSGLDSLTGRRIFRYRVPLPVFCRASLCDWLSERRSFIARLAW